MTPVGRAARVAAAAAGLAGLAAALTAAAQPDLSGIWTSDGGQGRAAVWPADPPYTPEARAKVEAYRALVEPTGVIPGEFCVGRGMPASMLMSGGYPMEIVQRPEQITIIYELYTEVRRIYMAGPAVDPADLFATRNGHSTGRWEGNTLVVETGWLKEALDQVSAHSADARLTERYRLARDPDGRKLLTAELTVVDPAFYEEPVIVTKTWAAMEDGRMLLYECNEPAWEAHLERLAEQAAAPASDEAPNRP